MRATGQTILGLARNSLHLGPYTGGCLPVINGYGRPCLSKFIICFLSNHTNMIYPAFFSKYIMTNWISRSINESRKARVIENMLRNQNNEDISVVW